MLLLSRDHISLQLYYTGSEVQIMPPMGEYEPSHPIYTYAYGEELLAQEFLDTTLLWSPLLQLRAFMVQLGWSVEEVEGSSY